ncbi:sigma-54 dependent transcriptional regulator [Azohydromonas caseinilytica]|uniref:Sigma-54-dependent Fis family transcriptional regulator n=1 Tax=Azohydromonas caseinilytica TaxID=2728836 RepID=A0A848FH73_9BURK|nr:sigma-54 dependent transcriptional regulator [Azohydromonas caseinilytica]NML17639.1 sigma-54-dependent Fis family transcriptional regulator [Azohydromonas caseinilytica]
MDSGPPRRLLCVGQRLEALQAGLAQAGWQVYSVPDFAAAERTLRDTSITVGLLVSTSEDEAAWARAGEFVQATELVWVALLQRQALRQPACLDLVLGGLFDHHHLPPDMPRLLATLGHAHGLAALRQERRNLASEQADVGIVGRSPATRQLLAQIRRVARVDAPVLVQGESGTGKELAAHAIHLCSPRRDGPFVALDCGSLQSPLFPAEPAGPLRGEAAAGLQHLGGHLQAANGGTLFLDEVADLPPGLQIALLRLLQERSIHRPGSAQDIEVDVRVIAATHVQLEEAARAGRFRQDLYYRLSVLHLQMPPLRERPQDIALLAQHFYALYAHERRPGLRGFSRGALASLQAHAWPGNVRELNNRIRRAVVMASRRLIRPEDLGFEQAPSLDPADALDMARTAAERNAILASLRRAGSNVTQAARELGISRMTLYRLMAKHGIRH